GIPGEGFVFVGFAPSRPKARKSWLQKLAREPRPLVIYEAPHRILAMLEDVASELGNRKVAVGRELTKVHEHLAVRPVQEWLVEPPVARGEFTLVVAGYVEERADARVPPTDAVVALFYGQLTDIVGLGRREALKDTADHFGWTTRQVFGAVERQKCRSEDIK
ncbi:MAG: 16S rRNA (cytidine(1402)-2'-O)-methyltransferase, partial [Vicinamibacterales bacterium]